MKNNGVGRIKRMRWLVLVIILGSVGLFLRTYQWRESAFGFDQVQILEQAEKIRSGDFSLIGPRTGPGGMFTGPLVYYLAALFVGLSVGTNLLLMVVIVYLIGLVVLVGVSASLIGREKSLVLVALWSLSLMTVGLERIVWNPMLSMLAFGLVVVPLYQMVHSMSVGWKAVVAIWFGMLLGYQAHFSGLLLLPLVWLIWLGWIRKDGLRLVVASSGYLISLLPSLVFELRNDWLMTKNLVNFLESDVTVGSGLGNGLLRVVKVIIELPVVTVLFRPEWYVSMQLGIWFWVGVGWWLVGGRMKPAEKAMFAWIVMVMVGYAFYSGPLPEYYFLILMPALLLLMVNGIALIMKAKTGLVMLLVWAGINVFAVARMQVFSGANGFEQQEDVAEYVIKLSELGDGVSEVVYDTEAPRSDGVRYLLGQVTLSEGGSIVHVSYPVDKSGKAAMTSGDYGVWIDNRTRVDKNYVESKDFVIETNKQFEVVEIVDISESADQFLVISKGELVGKMTIQRVDEELQIDRANSNKAGTQIEWDEGVLGDYWVQVGEWRLQIEAFKFDVADLGLRMWLGEEMLDGEEVILPRKFF